MGLTKKEMLQAFLSGSEGANPYAQGDEARKTQGNKATLDATEAANADLRARKLADYFGRTAPGMGFTVKSGDTSISRNEKAIGPGLSLTPAQKAGEKKAGEVMADYDALGGSAQVQRDIGQLNEVKSDLTPEIQGGDAKRDTYDRVVGGALGGFPSLMGMLAPSEKGRRDKARNAIIAMIRKTDPNPTQQQVESLFGQVYDPSSTNEENLSRISKFSQEQEAKAQAMEATKNRLRSTGYATLQDPDAPPSPVAAPAAPPQDEAAEFQNFYHNIFKKAKNAPIPGR